jgi:hypothetical protein
MVVTDHRSHGVDSRRTVRAHCSEVRRGMAETFGTEGGECWMPRAELTPSAHPEILRLPTRS